MLLQPLLELLLLGRQHLHPLLQLAQLCCPLLRGHRRNRCLSWHHLRSTHTPPRVELMEEGKAQRAWGGGGPAQGLRHRIGTARWGSLVPRPRRHP